ncbi:MAG: hypothetical protein ABTD50_00845 [Polyangiaceae bacterium]|jgi:hypothetical protein
MTGSASDKGDPKAFDVVLVQGATDDGAGSRVVRARPGRLEAGEVRPVKSGTPLAPGGEVVRLSPRAESAALFDVHVEFTASAETPGQPGTDAPGRSGPAQVATSAYRDSWERTFHPAGHEPPAGLLN